MLFFQKLSMFKHVKNHITNIVPIQKKKSEKIDYSIGNAAMPQFLNF